MRWLIFLSRVAFLSGIVMLIAISSGVTPLYKTETGLSGAILAGYGLAAFLLPLMGILYGLLALFNRTRLISVPKWLIISNLFFLTIFLFFTFYFNDPYYNQG